MKRLHKIIYLPAILLLFCFTACTDNIGLEENARVSHKNYDMPGVLKPLALGNTWKYLVCISIPDSSAETWFTESHEITELVLTDEAEWFTEEITPYKGWAFYTQVYLLNTIEGLSISSNSDKLELISYFPYPCYKGQTITIEINSSMDGFFPSEAVYVQRSVEQLDTVITLKTGEFHCIKYTDDLLDKKFQNIYHHWNIYYYSPGVGLVESWEVFPSLTDGRNYRYYYHQLLDYDIN